MSPRAVSSAASRLCCHTTARQAELRGVHANHHKVLFEQALKSDSLRKVLLTLASRYRTTVRYSVQARGMLTPADHSLSLPPSPHGPVRRLRGSLSTNQTGGYHQPVLPTSNNRLAHEPLIGVKNTPFSF